MTGSQVGRRKKEKRSPKGKDFHENRKRLEELLLPFDEVHLAQNAREALKLLQKDPDLLDPHIIRSLVAEIPTAELKEGVVGRPARTHCHAHRTRHTQRAMRLKILILAAGRQLRCRLWRVAASQGHVGVVAVGDVRR